VNVFVSGAAGDIGWGVVKILSDWGIANSLLVADASGADFAAAQLADTTIESPGADSPAYVSWLASLVQEKKLDLVIPTTEAEIRALTDVDITLFGSAALLINTSDMIKTCLDKQRTLDYLQSKGVMVPDHGVVGELDPEVFPVIVKPRFGRGSRDIQIVKKLAEYQTDLEDFVWQEYLNANDCEYTCAVYVSPHLEAESIQIRRTLKGGYTDRGEICFDESISKYLRSIIEAFGVPGCFNVQLRMTDRGPLLFEINPRLSSTLVFRDTLGFQDLRWWISDTFGIKKSEYLAPKEGTKFFRVPSGLFIGADK
jgi:carbamoyl-phosphate synthase large subunit